MYRKPEIISVQSAPKVPNLAFVSGIASSDRAEAWADNHKYRRVYYWKRTQRLYYEKRQNGTEQISD